MSVIFNFDNASESLQQEIQNGKVVTYTFSNPTITSRIKGLNKLISGLDWPKDDKDKHFIENLDKLTSGLKDLDESCHSFNEDLLKKAQDAIAGINIRKGSIKKSLLILHNNLPLEDRGTYSLPRGERFDSRIMEYPVVIGASLDRLQLFQKYIIEARAWKKVYDDCPVIMPAGRDDMFSTLLQVLELTIKVVSSIKNSRNIKKAKNELLKTKATLPQVLSEIEAHLTRIDMFVIALDNIKQIYDWVDTQVGTFFDKAVKETDFKLGLINEILSKDKIEALWISNELMKELAEKQIIPYDTTAKSYVECVCECSDRLVSKRIEKPEELYYFE